VFTTYISPGITIQCSYVLRFIIDNISAPTTNQTNYLHVGLALLFGGFLKHDYRRAAVQTSDTAIVRTLNLVCIDEWFRERSLVPAR